MIVVLFIAMCVGAVVGFTTCVVAFLWHTRPRGRLVIQFRSSDVALATRGRRW